MPLIKLFPDGLLRRLILDQLAKTTGVDLNTLSKMSGANASAKDSHPYAPKQAPSEPTVPVKEHPDNSIPKARSKSTHSACKKAVNLILLKPEIVSKIEVDTSIKQLKSNDIDLLFEVIDLAKSFPSNSTHELLGRVYDTPIGSQLIQLQDREQITPATGIENEFKEIMQYLAKIAEREALIAKGKQTFAAKNQ